MTLQDHIAILVCDTPIDPLSKTYGDFGHQCQVLLQKGGSKLPSIRYQICHINEERELLQATFDQLTVAINNNNVKGVIVTGSRSDSFDTLWWIKMLDEFITGTLFNSQIPLVGLCFGHQILAKNLQVKVNRSSTWELGLQEIKLKDDVAHSFPFDVLQGDTCNLIEFHQDIVYQVPSGVKLIGSSNDCVVQGLLSLTNLKLLTFQGHPEFSSAFSVELLDQLLTSNKISQDQYDAAVSSIEKKQNAGSDIAKVICNFISGESPTTTSDSK